MPQALRCPRIPEELFAANPIFGEMRVQYLDGHTLLLCAVIRIPDHREAAATHEFHEEMATITQSISRT